MKAPHEKRAAFWEFTNCATAAQFKYNILEYRGSATPRREMLASLRNQGIRNRKRATCI